VYTSRDCILETVGLYQPGALEWEGVRLKIIRAEGFERSRMWWHSSTPKGRSVYVIRDARMRLGVSGQNRTGVSLVR
jgi:hypothetical protein